MTDSQRDVIGFLSDPNTDGLKSGAVERHETHGAIVFLAGERAYKLKRAVRYPYMDYSTVAARRAMCERELAVNRRTAPELYLEVRPILRDPNGRLRFGSQDQTRGALDWVVVMRRFEQSGLLAEMRRRGLLTRTLMRMLGETIAEFHERAEVTSSYGGAAGIGAVIDENAALLRDIGVDAAKAEFLALRSRAALASVDSLLDRRRSEGRVRRCHGDLHLNNICMIEGRPVLFDAIEFNDAFACIDVLYDLAFPLMDLMRHRLAPLANVLLNRYLERTGDYEGLAALPLFLSCRAAINAHVAVSRARETQADVNAAQAESMQLLDLAINCLERSAPRAIAIGGVSGTGKSTLAYELAPALAPAPGAIVLRSDVLRKRIMGVPETARLPEGAYTEEMHGRVYAAITGYAASILAGGYSVVADAVYGEPEHRAAISRIAGAACVPFTGLWLEAPSESLETRIAARRDDASDATVQVLRRQLAHLKPPPDWTKIDAVYAAADTLTAACRAIASEPGAPQFAGDPLD